MSDASKSYLQQEHQVTSQYQRDTINDSCRIRDGAGKRIAFTSAR